MTEEEKNKIRTIIVDLEIAKTCMKDFNFKTAGIAIHIVYEKLNSMVN